MTTTTSTPHIVIIGGGFAGLNTVRYLKDAPVSITLIDKNNTHVFQPLLYQVATGELASGDIATPLRSIFSQQKNVRVLLGEMTGIDPENRKVSVMDTEISYDYLVLACGARVNYFGNPDWQSKAPGLKNLEDALEIRKRVLMAFEKAEWIEDPKKRAACLTFVVIGGGPTGVELAGALTELARYSLRHNFKSIKPEDARILLVEGSQRILNGFPEKLSRHAKKYLLKLGISVRNSCYVREISEKRIRLESGNNSEWIEAETILWAAGVSASNLGNLIKATCNAELDRMGRIMVMPDFSVPGYPAIFVLGDLANYPHDTGSPLPGLATVALQEGRYLAKLIMSKCNAMQIPPFHYQDRGSMAVIGRNAAIADLHFLQLHGFAAWVIWVLIHIHNLIAFDRKLLVLFEWAWNYFTRRRSNRIILSTDFEDLDDGT